jgi:hypothetical protein
MSETNTNEEQSQPGPKHVLRRNLLGRPRPDQQPAKRLVELYRAG